MSDVDGTIDREKHADEIVEEEPVVAKRRLDWSLNSWGARLVYSFIAGWVINIATGIYALGTTVAVVLFVLTSAIVYAGRHR